MIQGVVSAYARPYEVVKCTTRSALTSGLATRPDISLIVTSVLSNFLCDAGKKADPNGILEALNEEIISHVSAVSSYATTNVSSRIVIVPPLPRSTPDWFGPYLPGLTALLSTQVNQLASSQVRCLAPFIAPASYFDSDGVHLNPAAGVEFIRYIISGVDQVFPVVDCTALTSPASAPVCEVRSLSSAVRELTSVTEKFRDDTLTRRAQDNLVFARLKEDRDFELNKSRENRFTVSGLQLRGDQVPPRDPVERKNFFKVILQALVDEACPSVDPKPVIQDVYVNMRHGVGTPFIEARMDSVASATSFRVAASKLAKDESPNFNGLFIANAVTLTTRVRIEILRALAKTVSTGSIDAFVKGFSSRPVLCVKPKTAPSAPGDAPPAGLSSGPSTPSDSGRHYTFCEAVEKWGHTLTQFGLASAYRKARPAFNGCLEQYFVVLREFQEDENDGIFGLLSGQPSGSNSYPLGNTRGWSGSSQNRGRYARGGRSSGGRRPWTRPGSFANKRPLSDVEESPSKFRK